MELKKQKYTVHCLPLHIVAWVWPYLPPGGIIPNVDESHETNTTLSILAALKDVTRTCLSLVRLHAGNKVASAPDENGAFPSGSSQTAPDPGGPKAMPQSTPFTEKRKVPSTVSAIMVMTSNALSGKKSDPYSVSLEACSNIHGEGGQSQPMLAPICNKNSRVVKKGNGPRSGGTYRSTRS